MKSYSFWKVLSSVFEYSDSEIEGTQENEPQPIISIGSVNEVVSHLLSIPKLYQLQDRDEDDPTALVFKWIPGKSVWLRIRPELVATHPDPQILTIWANSESKPILFYILYMQLYEHFGVVLMDNDNKEFIGLKEFKKLNN